MLSERDRTLRDQIIKLVIMKCRKDTVDATLNKWGRLSKDILHSLKGKTKSGILETVIAAVEKEQDLTVEIMGDLELSYIQLHSRTKLWKVFRFSGSEMKLSQDPRALRSHLLANIQLKLKHGKAYGNMSYFAGGQWFRLHLSTSHARRKADHYVYNPTRSIFVVAFAGSPYVIVSQTSGQSFKIVSEALTEVFKAERLHDIKLSGRHMASLADIALKKNHEANVCSYRQLEVDGNPLVLGHKRKQLDEEFEDRDDMTDENRKEKRLRNLDLVKKFGSDPQPVLETLEYNFDLPFRGKSSDEMTDHCKSTVQLKGPSVLEGLGQMARQGFLKFPLPLHVFGATSSQRNHFSVVSRKDQPQ